MLEDSEGRLVELVDKCDRSINIQQVVVGYLFAMQAIEECIE